STAQMALEEATFETKTINIEFEVNFPYSEMDKVMRLIRKHRLNIVSQQMELECALQIAVRQSEADTIADLFKKLHKVTVTRYG
ncbi:MAG: YigZ family protein, partial [Eudoraea sp.]|nr:YigZ family protein [Eudoraea sp.]